MELILPNVLQTGEPLKVLEGHTGQVFSLLLEPPFVWSSSWDKSIILWDFHDKTFKKELKGPHSDAVSCLLSVGNEVWSASWDKTISIWKASGS